MYSYIKGELVKITDDMVVVENNGIGYEIICPFALSSKLGHVGTDVCVWLYQSVREDDISLYGFSELTWRLHQVPWKLPWHPPP